MRCPQRFAAALQETETSPDGKKMYTWRAVRRQQLGKLRKQTRSIVFFMALIELMRVSPLDLVYEGKHGTKAPGPEDYGISHTVAGVFAWLFVAAFAIFYVPIFSWWASPSSTTPDKGTPPSQSEPSKSTLFLEKVGAFLTKFNYIVLHSCVAVHLAQHAYHVFNTFKYVGPRPYNPKEANPALNTRKAWGIRALLFAGVCTSFAMGKLFFMILEEVELARVKPLEYLIIVLPFQINFGILMATAVQFKAEKRAARKVAMRRADAEVAPVEEKERLLLLD